MMEESLYNTRTSPWLPTRRAADIPGDSLLVLQGRGGSEFGLRAGDIARGVYLVGASRSGKTTVLCHCLAQLIPRLGPHDGLLVFDPRRDFQRRFCRQGDFVLDPDPQGSGNAVWSLFADLVAFGTSDYALEQNAARIAARMFSGKENQMNPFFTTAPRRLLENLLLVYAREILAHPEQAHRYGNHTLLQFCAGLSRQRLEELIRRSPAVPSRPWGYWASSRRRSHRCMVSRVAMRRASVRWTLPVTAAAGSAIWRMMPVPAAAWMLSTG